MERDLARSRVGVGKRLGVIGNNRIPDVDVRRGYQQCRVGPLSRMREEALRVERFMTVDRAYGRWSIMVVCSAGQH